MEASETVEERIARLRPLIQSTAFAITEDDVRWDYETGRNRYAMPDGDISHLVDTSGGASA
jgi:hypothetical protein